jgi:archaellum component FlaC
MGKFQRESDAILSDDGVTVYQVFSEDEFSVPAVALKVASERPSPVRVRLRQEVPPELAIDEIGFHPDYGEENWSIDGERMTYETELPADSETTTIYAIGGGGHRQIDKLLDGLSIDEVEAVGSPDADAADMAVTATDAPGDDRRADASGAPDTAGESDTIEESDPADVTAEPGDSDTAGGADSSDVLLDDEQLSAEDGATQDNGSAGAPDVEGTDPGAPGDGAAVTPSGGDGEPAGASTEPEPETETETDTEPEQETETEPDTDGAEAGADRAGVTDRSRDGGDGEDTDDDGEPLAKAEDTEDGDRTPADPGDGRPGQEETAAEDGTGDSPEDVPLGAHDDDALVREIQRRLDGDGLSDGARERLRDSLQEAGVPAGSAAETRIDHLQQRVSDIEAFTDSLQQLHEEHGPPAEAFGEMSAEIEAFDERIEAFDERVEALDDRIEAVEAVEPKVDSLGADVEGLADDVATVRDDVDGIESEQETLEKEIAQLREWREAVTRTVAGFDQS